MRNQIRTVSLRMTAIPILIALVAALGVSAGATASTGTADSSNGQSPRNGKAASAGLGVRAAGPPQCELPNGTPCPTKVKKYAKKKKKKFKKGKLGRTPKAANFPRELRRKVNRKLRRSGLRSGPSSWRQLRRSANCSVFDQIGSRGTCYDGGSEVPKEVGKVTLFCAGGVVIWGIPGPGKAAAGALFRAGGSCGWGVIGGSWIFD